MTRTFDRALAAIIDHTLLRADARAADIARLCAEARDYGFASVCVNPAFVPLAVRELAGSAIPVCTVIGFPLGASASIVKRIEVMEAYELGAREFDMVLPVGLLLSGMGGAVAADINAVTRAAKECSSASVVKVILETCYLGDAEKETACMLAMDAGADFVKTSTGFGPSGATAADVALLRRLVGSAMGVKASGGIRDAATARAMVEAGASRLGTSASVEIVRTQSAP